MSRTVAKTGRWLEGIEGRIQDQGKGDSREEKGRGDRGDFKGKEGKEEGKGNGKGMGKGKREGK